ncbi:MAG: YceI family protein [Myxococcales bacterium]|nr:YceI family protein [Myxococcales bacterium]
MGLWIVVLGLGCGGAEEAPPATNVAEEVEAPEEEPLADAAPEVEEEAAEEEPGEEPAEPAEAEAAEPEAPEPAAAAPSDAPPPDAPEAAPDAVEDAADGSASAEEEPEEPAEPEPTGPLTYRLDPSKGRLYVLVRYQRGGLGGALGHDHVIVAQGWSGTVTWDQDDPSACAVSIDVPVGGLSVDPGNSRSWEGLDGSTSDGDKSTITKNFSGEKQLFSSRFPDIRYRSSSCQRQGSSVNVTGAITIRGVSKTITLPMTIDASDDSFSASGTFRANHTDFGFKPFRALAGALKNDDGLKFVVNVRGTAASR